MNLVYGSFCPVHEGKSRCPCRCVRFMSRKKSMIFAESELTYCCTVPVDCWSCPLVGYFVSKQHIVVGIALQTRCARGRSQ